MLPVPAAANDARLIELWLHGRSPHTQRAYAADIAQLLAHAGKPLAALTLADFQVFAASLEHLAPSSRYRTLSAVKSLIGFGHRLGYLPFDAARPLRLPAAGNRLAERILPESDVLRLIRLEPDPRNHAILLLLYATGIRVSEVCRLRWRDLQPTAEAGQITVLGKGSRTRSIPVPPKVWRELRALDAQPRPDAPVFPAHTRPQPLTPLGVFKIVRRAAGRAGIEEPVSPHWLRHAHASHALDHGAPIHLVQATLGHASIVTTGRYLHARPKEGSGRYLKL